MDDLMGGIRGALDEAEEAMSAEAGGDAEVAEDQDDQEEAAAAPEDGEQEVAEDEVDETSEGGDEEPEAGSSDWLDRVDELPVTELPPRVAKLRTDRDRLASEVGEMRKQIAELKAGQKAPESEQQKAPESEDPMPEMPTEADDFQTVVQKLRDVARWEARQEAKGVDSRYREKFQTIEDREKQQQFERQQEYFASQAQRIEQAPDYSPEVGQMMSALVSSKPYWQQALSSPDGWNELFDYAKHLSDKNARQVQATTKKATAKQRAVPRGTKAPKQVEPDVDLPEDPTNVSGRIGAIMDSYGG